MPIQRKRKNIVKDLDNVFSRYIRLRYAKDEVCECYTCGKKAHYKDGMQAGHFRSRRHYATRWNELNVQVQCYGCNVGKQGEQYKFGVNLDKEYGVGTAEMLEIESHKTVKFSNQDLIELTDYYKKKLKDLEFKK